MAEYSSIEWTDHTFNPWVGCTKVSPGCLHCYAKAQQDDRLHRVEWGLDRARRLTSDENWRKPMKWHERCLASGIRQRVFCGSLCDVFDGEVPRAWRARLWALIEATPALDWLLLTKRPANISGMVPWPGQWPANVWCGVTVEDFTAAVFRLPILSETPAAVRFVSAEPLLSDFRLGDARVDWLICGGESGHGFRAVDPAHVRSLRDQCEARGIPFFFKQWGGIRPKAGGKTLDGKQHCDFPNEY